MSIRVKQVSNKIGGRGNCYPTFLRGRGSIERSGDSVFEPGEVIINRATGAARVVTGVDASDGSFTAISAGTARVDIPVMPTNFHIDRNGRITVK